MKKYGLLITILVISGGLVGIFVAFNNQPAKQQISSLGDSYPDLGQDHIAVGAAHKAYNSNMPSSGPHYTPAVTWGLSDAPIADERLVHNLEHGGVVIAYKPDLPADQVAQLKQTFAGLPKSSQFNEVKAILVPRAANTTNISMAAWTHTLNSKTIDSGKILEFYKTYLDKGPELVP